MNSQNTVLIFRFHIMIGQDDCCILKRSEISIYQAKKSNDIG